MQLIKLAQLAEQQMNDTEKRYKASAVSINEVISAKIKWLEARCKVAEDRKDYREAINLLGQIKEALDELFEIGKKRVAAGVMPVSELTPMKEAIINTEMRLTQVKEQAGKAKE